ncbi:MAG TPA: type II toxin-antitoxin system Phd/YefM family antitoxin [Candidatus Sabulitectum sp.]|nr:type II toxin-antitoxin system Phd/YefM family antitoxin [Candidatus Sabulitectum sp.]HPJ28059.1 type II toxin-antitoxin system Phd/YefM family antitoxin [Candidatus Sabulitectum sp.]HPR21245.1 type II toxin-antitoxin system Phd/YefM family antitoxin [Candidatus Sabulitectum sp.]
MEQVLSSYSASISELKKNPTALLREADGEAITILNHNVPTAYLVPAETYEMLLDRLEDAELARVVLDRQCEKEQAVEVDIDNV